MELAPSHRSVAPLGDVDGGQATDTDNRLISGASLPSNGACLVLPGSLGPEKSSRRVYTDVTPHGYHTVLGVILVVIGVFAVQEASTLAVTFVWQGLVPSTQVCECPANADAFDATAFFYAECLDPANAFYATHNAVPGNTSLSADGWFATFEYTRETLAADRADAQFQVGVHAGVASVYACPLYRAFWWAPVQVVSIVIMGIGVVLFGLGVVGGVTRSVTLFEDRIEVRSNDSTAGTRVVFLHKIVKVKPHELAGFPPLRCGALTVVCTEASTVKGDDPTKKGRVKIQVSADPKSPLQVTVVPLHSARFVEALARVGVTEDGYGGAGSGGADVEAAVDAGTGIGESPAADAERSTEVTVPAGHTPSHAESLPALPSNDTIDAGGSWTSFKTKVTCGFMLRTFIVCVVVVVVGHYLFRALLFLAMEVFEPGRPKRANEAEQTLLSFGIEDIAVAVIALVGALSSMGAKLSHSVAVSPQLIVRRGGNYTDDKWKEWSLCRRADLVAVRRAAGDCFVSPGTVLPFVRLAWSARVNAKKKLTHVHVRYGARIAKPPATPSSGTSAQRNRLAAKQRRKTQDRQTVTLAESNAFIMDEPEAFVDGLVVQLEPEPDGPAAGIGTGAVPLVRRGTTCGCCDPVTWM